MGQGEEGDTEYTERDHEYDAMGRLVKSSYRQWWDSDPAPVPDTLEHIYAGARHIENYDGSSTYGKRWHWAGAAHGHGGPLRNPNADTASQERYNQGNNATPVRASGTVGSTLSGDQRHEYGQGRPMTKDTTMGTGGRNWSVGTKSDSTDGQAQVESRLMFEGTITATDMDRATDSREKQRMGIFGTVHSYAGSSGRVTSEPIGRDLNPLGRGSGQALVGGALNLGVLYRPLPGNMAGSGTGGSVNNCGGCGFTGGDGSNAIPLSSQGPFGTPYDPRDKPYCCDCGPEPHECEDYRSMGKPPDCIDEAKRCCPEMCSNGGLCGGIAGETVILKCPWCEEFECNLETHPCKSYDDEGQPCSCGLELNRDSGCEEWMGEIAGLLASHWQEAKCCLDKFEDENVRECMHMVIDPEHNKKGQAPKLPIVCCEAMGGNYDLWTRQGGSSRDVGCTCICSEHKAPTPGGGTIQWGQACAATAEKAESVAGCPGSTAPFEEVPPGIYMCWDKIVDSTHPCSTFYFEETECNVIALYLHEQLRQFPQCSAEGMTTKNGKGIYKDLASFVRCFCEQVTANKSEPPAEPGGGS